MDVIRFNMIILLGACLFFTILSIVRTSFSLSPKQEDDDHDDGTLQDEDVKPSEIMNELLKRRGFESIRMTEPFTQLNKGSTGTFKPLE
jgi:hypothetical protein